jgi:ppGpp synthetase/RelA/SpoT-type nucleotidyltranferase
MKVPQSIGDIYDEVRPAYVNLGRAVDDLLRGQLLKEWHYISRVKERESFAQKVETGRFSDLRKLEDFFACTIVVRNMTEIADVERRIGELFHIDQRRPPKPNFMHSDPESFDFDHVRLYVRWRDDERAPPTAFTDIPFEVQLKTYLQHAWAIATHELIYKTDDVNWRKARIGYQVKAMLEHAEMSISHAEQLAASAELQVENKDIDEIRSMIDLLKTTWVDDPARLPEDIRRLADNVLRVIQPLQMSVDQLKQDLAAELEAGRGRLIETLSPFGVVIQTLLQRHEAEMRDLLTGRNRRLRGRDRIVIPAEIEFPTAISRAACSKALFISVI